MFRGHRAWFSQSVSPGPRQLWAAGGGVLAHPRDADYLFSSDAAHPDTRRIHESLDYLEGRATVFHSCYLSAWASTGTGVKASVVLGHFVLPPACLQEEIRKKIGSFIWEQADDSLAEQSQPNENVMDKLGAARKGYEEEVEEDALDLAESSEEETGSRAPAQGEFPYRALREYPMNNMVTAARTLRARPESLPSPPHFASSVVLVPSQKRSSGFPHALPFVGYASARDMKKYVGELRDFIPGTSGYAAYWIQNEINVYSDVKTKMKRKLCK
ncbi:telomere repeats-binding bouquet formation protein 2 [Morus bassanus]